MAPAAEGRNSPHTAVRAAAAAAAALQVLLCSDFKGFFFVFFSQVYYKKKRKKKSVLDVIYVRPLKAKKKNQKKITCPVLSLSFLLDKVE